MFSVCNNCSIESSRIENHPERISNIKPFIDQYNWKGIDFSAGIKDWKKFEQNNCSCKNNKSCIQIKM